MKKTVLAVMVAGSALMGSMASYAADGQVKFVGNITADACTVDAASKSMTVTLGDVATTAFTAKGDKSSATAFQLTVSACPDTVNHVAIKFDGASDSVDSTLLALDSGMTATAVAVEIADAQGNPLPLHTLSPSYAVTNKTATLDLVGRYVSTGATVGAGTADATSQFTLNYQ